MQGSKPETILAEIKDGSIVELKKECGCLPEIHTGPHWVHVDRIERQMNRRLLGAGNYLGFAVAEIRRLQEKRYQMESRGIVRLIFEDSPTGEEEQ